jgi:hypothetical protein
MAKKKSTAIAKKESIAVVKGGVSETRPDFVPETKNEQMDRDELLIPRVDVAQALSPQIVEGNEGYIEGLKQGDLFNTATGTVYGKTLRFVSVHYQKEFLVFKDRLLGGGFRGTYDTEQDALRAIEELKEEGLEVVLSLSNLIFIVDKDGLYREMAFLSATKTKLKAARKLNTHCQMVKAPRYASVFELTSVKDESPKGAFYNFSIRSLGWLADRDTFEQAAQVAESMAGQRFKGDHSESTEVGDGEF